jgi:hypothetical protein
MTLAHGADRLESARLVLRRIAPNNLGASGLPSVRRRRVPPGR